MATAQQVRRNQVRASQACNHCRSRKQKCEEARPCQLWRENNFDCQYKDVPPPKTHGSCQPQPENGIARRSPLEHDVATRCASISFYQARVAIRSASSTTGNTCRDVRTDRSHATETSPKEQTGLQGDHTTPAHKLLDEWQQTSIFYQGMPYLRRMIDNGREVSGYPMQHEQDRGLLRVWAENGTRTPGSIPREYFPHQQQQRQENGLGADDRPDFRCHVMFDLLRSYMETMHIFHPSMNEHKLKRMFKDLSDRYSPDAKPLNAHSHAPVHGVKRKRSASNLHGLPSGRTDIERSLRNANILLVLALGKVCSHTEPLPAPQNGRHPHVHSEWGYIRNSPHPNGSFSSAYATDILGNQQGGNTVEHAQAMLLAALFLSQMTSLIPSQVSGVISAAKLQCSASNRKCTALCEIFHINDWIVAARRSRAGRYHGRFCMQY
ncbi:hypothetical protein T440DRAFT_461624 [Plenodomus tracheiphilus IPT5]|uniref:Zn(2)-C6 fungal-type domain-containing protein n=1 Tax=Plenodomus tracheiphilus IPT5 TaxID=1408161 RepID=A0A6A7AND5_9PLEO|nr:hypothetical protein T440DRAFT_461624 [Plenodomus tracheiphilus IPT5]